MTDGERPTKRRRRGRSVGYRDAAPKGPPKLAESREIRARIREKLGDGMNPDDVSDELMRQGHDPEWARGIVERVDIAVEQRPKRRAGRRRRGRRREGLDGDWEELALLERRAHTILVLGLLSVTVCNVLAPVAWLMGNQYVVECHERGIRPADTAAAGRILGIFGSVLLGLVIFFLVFML